MGKKVKVAKPRNPSERFRVAFSVHKTAGDLWNGFGVPSMIAKLANEAGLIAKVAKNGVITVDTSESVKKVRVKLTDEEKTARKEAIANYRKLVKTNGDLAAKLLSMSPEKIAEILAA